MAERRSFDRQRNWHLQVLSGDDALARMLSNRLNLPDGQTDEIERPN